MFASREVSLEAGFACHPDDGGDNPQMLVNKIKSKEISKVLESGISPLGGNNKSHCFLNKTFLLNRSLKIRYLALRPGTRLAGG